jgi:hypothetical protein
MVRSPQFEHAAEAQEALFIIIPVIIRIVDTTRTATSFQEHYKKKNCYSGQQSLCLVRLHGSNHDGIHRFTLHVP